MLACSIAPFDPCLNSSMRRWLLRRCWLVFLLLQLAAGGAAVAAGVQALRDTE